MVRHVASILAAFLFATCGYDASFRDCSIACTAETGCPGSFSCGEESLCRSPGASQTCGSVLGDAGISLADGAHTDSSVDAAPHDVTLAETSDVTDVSTAGFSCMPCPTGSMAQSGQFPVNLYWYREFSLSDFTSVEGPFQLNVVHVGCSSVIGTATISIVVYAYTGGALFAPTIDTTALTQIGQGSAQIEMSSCTADVSVPISATQSVPSGGAFVVQVGVVDTLEYDMDVTPSCELDPSFKIGANTSTDLRRSYYRSPTLNCATGSAASTPTESSGSADVLISVEGLAE